MKSDSEYLQGIPDLLILFNDKWATLECKKSAGALRFATVAVCSVMLVACGENKGTQIPNKPDETINENRSESETKIETKETIDFSVDKGSLKYIGAEKANEALVSVNKDVDKDKFIILKFEYTNKQEEPNECQNTFYIQTFQNKVKINKSFSYSSRGGEQYELCHNYSSDVLKDGTVTFERLVYVDDNSPLTIIVKENGADNEKKQMMELDIESVMSGKSEEQENDEQEEKKELIAEALDE